MTRPERGIRPGRFQLHMPGHKGSSIVHEKARDCRLSIKFEITFFLSIQNNYWYLYWSKHSIQGSKKKPCSNSHPIIYTKAKESIENNPEKNKRRLLLKMFILNEWNEKNHSRSQIMNLRLNGNLVDTNTVIVPINITGFRP